MLKILKNCWITLCIQPCNFALWCKQQTQWTFLFRYEEDQLCTRRPGVSLPLQQQELPRTPCKYKMTPGPNMNYGRTPSKHNLLSIMIALKDLLRPSLKYINYPLLSAEHKWTFSTLTQVPKNFLIHEKNSHEFLSLMWMQMYFPAHEVIAKEQLPPPLQKKTLVSWRIKRGI